MHASVKSGCASVGGKPGGLKKMLVAANKKEVEGKNKSRTVVNFVVIISPHKRNGSDSTIPPSQRG